LNVQGIDVEGAYLGVARYIIDRLDQAKHPEDDHNDEHEPQLEADPGDALAEREDHIADRVLLDHRAVGPVTNDPLILKQSRVVHTLDHEYAEAGEEEYMKEVEELHEYERGHAVILVVLVDAREKLVQVVDMAPFSCINKNGIFL
jgi:hypothetical protein